MVHYTGEPPSTWTEIKTWLTSSTEVVKKVSLIKRCCFCWRGPPNSKTVPHQGHECGFFATFNKVRGHENLRPLVLENGRVNAEVKKVALTPEYIWRHLEKETKRFQATMGAMEKRVAALEKKPASKKRRIANTAPQAPPTTPKKAKATKPQTKTPAKSGKDGKAGKGKGKAVAMPSKAPAAKASSSKSGLEAWFEEPDST